MSIENWANGVTSNLADHATHLDLHQDKIEVNRLQVMYSVQFADINMISSMGAFLFGASQLLFLFVVIHTIVAGKKAPAKPWEGAEGLEWEVASPAPYHTFTTPPKID